jgi:hypothetical protein
MSGEFLMEQMSKISYTAIILSEESKNDLLNNIPVPEDWDIICHHMTLCLGEIPDTYKSMLGKKYMLRGDSYGKTDKTISFKVDNMERLIPGQSHITIAINMKIGAKPKDSNEIKNFDFKIKELVLTGILQEVPY